jgi:hypothetical protein
MPLGDLRESVGLVIRISDLRLPGDGHAGAADGEVRVASRDRVGLLEQDAGGKRTQKNVTFD